MKDRLRPCFLWRIFGVSAVFWRILASGVFKKKFREMRIRQTNTPDQIAAAYKRTTFWSFLNAPVWRILDRFTKCMKSQLKYRDNLKPNVHFRCPL